MTEIVEDVDAEGGAGSGKKSKLPLILMLVGGLVLGGGGATAFFTLFAEEEEDMIGVETAEDAAQKEIIELAPEYVMVDRISAPMIAQGTTIVGHVSMFVRLQVEDKDDQDWIQDREPMVRHAINVALTKRGVNFANDPFKIDYEGTAKAIREAVNTYLKTKKVLGATITEAVRL